MSTTAAELAAKLQPDQTPEMDRMFPALAEAERAAGLRPEEIGVVLNLAGRKFEIPRKYSADNRAWREKFKASAAPIQALIGLAKTIHGDNMQAAIRALDIGDIATAVESAMPALIGSIDDLADLLFEYDPILFENRAEILKRSFDEDLIGAFIQVLQAVYPAKKFMAAYGSGIAARATT